MSLSDEVTKINTIFMDTAPIIYYIEAHPQFGPFTKEINDIWEFNLYLFLRLSFNSPQQLSRNPS